MLAAEIFRTPIGEMPMDVPLSVPHSRPVWMDVAAMKAGRTTCILLTDDHGRLTCIFTARDALLRLGDVAVGEETHLIADFMTRAPDTLTAGDAVAYALNAMHLGGHRHVSVVDATGRPVGVLGTREIVAWHSEYFREEAFNRPPEPSRAEPMDIDGA